MDAFLLLHGFFHYHSYPNVYILCQDDSLLLVVLYVDDLLITNSLEASNATMKDLLDGMFLVSDLHQLHYLFGIDITQSSSGITMR